MHMKSSASATAVEFKVDALLDSKDRSGGWYNARIIKGYVCPFSQSLVRSAGGSRVLWRVARGLRPQTS